MRVLLDTHAFLWLITGDPRVSQAATALFLDQQHQMHLSVASIWEIAIKLSLGKLSIAGSPEHVLMTEIRQNGIQLLDIRFAHAMKVMSLPFHHRDPFDRLLIAQSEVEGLNVLSNDVAFDAYGVNRVW